MIRTASSNICTFDEPIIIMSWITTIWSYISPVTLKKVESNFSGTLYITLENGRKTLNTNEVNYSFSSLHRIFQQAFKKTELRLKPDDSILMLGLGAGSIIDIIRKDYQSPAKITAVDIDPVIVEIARNEFNMDQYGSIDIMNEDAYTYMKHIKDQYNLICIDLFIQDQVPEPFLSAEFWSLVLAGLKSGGRIYFNFMDSTSKLTGLFNERIRELSSDPSISNLVQLQLEENNRVVVVSK